MVNQVDLGIQLSTIYSMWIKMYGKKSIDDWHMSENQN
jgi:hypothetical protein